VGRRFPPRLCAIEVKVNEWILMGGFKDVVKDNMFKEGFIISRTGVSLVRDFSPVREGITSFGRSYAACNAFFMDNASGLRCWSVYSFVLCLLSSGIS
jgi:hypothetical protein